MTLTIACVTSGVPSASDAEILSRFLPLPPNICICHFMKAKYFRIMLNQRALFFTRCDHFRDVSDGRLPDKNREEHSQLVSQLDGGYKKNSPGFKSATPQEKYDQVEIARRNTYVHCWFAGRVGHDQMWAEYGDAHKGVCIQTTTGLLMDALKSVGLSERAVIRAVAYSDKSQPITTVPFDIALFHKHEKYETEEEIRIIVSGLPQNKREFVDDRLKIPVNMKSIIQRITFGKSMTKQVRQELKDLITQVMGNLGACATSS